MRRLDGSRMACWRDEEPTHRASIKLFSAKDVVAWVCKEAKFKRERVSERGGGCIVYMVINVPTTYHEECCEMHYLRESWPFEVG